MELKFEKRILFKKNTKKLKKDNKIPVVCYGGGQKNISLQIDAKEFKKVLNSEDPVVDACGEINGKKLLIQEISRDILSRDPVHIDFLFVDERHEVEHGVPVELLGEAPAVKEKDGVIDFVKREINIKSLPQNIPQHIAVDMSVLAEIGDRITIADLVVSKDIVILDSEEDVVVSIVAQAEEIEEEPAGEIDFDAIAVEEKGKKPKEDEESEEKDK